MAVARRRAIAPAAAAVIVFTRPISVPLIIWTAVIALILVLILELLRRNPEAAGLGPPDESASGA